MGADQRLVQQVLRPTVGPATPAVAFVEGRPAPHGGSPFVGDLRQQVDAGPDVFAPLGVMGRGGQHGGRPAFGHLPVVAVELGRRDAEPARVAAHLVE
jgi:hypothetical protein